MTLSKIKTFYLKNKLVIGLAILLPLILSCNYVIEVCYALLPLVLLFFATCSFKEKMCCMFFFMAFSSVSPFFTGMLVSFILTTFLQYIIDLKNKSKPVYKIPLLLSLIIFVLFTTVFYKVNIWGFYNWALGTGLLFGGYLIFVYRQEIDIKLSFYFLMVGLVLSAILSGIVYVANIEGYEVLPFDGVYHRARFFTKHTNHLSMFSLFSLSYLLTMFASAKVKTFKEMFLTKNSIVHILFFVAISVIGFLTMSKTFLVIYVMLCLYLMVLVILKMKTKSLYIIIPCCLCVVALGFIFNDFIIKLFNRFTVYYTEGTLLTQILTNRDVVWKKYFALSTSSISRILFGAGMLSKGIGINPHNVLLYLFFRVGIIGMLLLGTLVWSYVKEAGTKFKVTYKNFLILFVFIVLSMIEMILSDRFFLFLVIGIMLISMQKSETQQTEESKIL